MSTNKASIGTPTEIACLLAGLTSGSKRQSAAVNFTSLRFLDLLLELTVTLPAGVIGADPHVAVYLARSLDGVTFSGGCSGSDAAYAAGLEVNMQHLGRLDTPTANGSYAGIFDTVAGPNAALVLPPYLAIVIVNNTGLTLTAGALRYSGAQITSE